MPRELHFGGLRTGAPQRVFIATPVIESPTPEYVFALLGSQVALAAAGIDYDIQFLIGDCHVDDARNDLTRDFLESDCTDLMFIDADVGWDPVDLVRLLRFDEAIVAGVYPRKTDTDQGYPVRLIPGALMTDPRGLISVAGVATGFLRIRREVLEQMWEVEPRKHKLLNEGEERKAVAIIFERLYENGERLSGDYGFCKKVTKAGRKIFIDPSFTFAHVGTKVWNGNAGRYWCEKEGMLTPRFLAGARRLRAGDARPEVFEQLFAEWGNVWAATSELCETVFDTVKGVSGTVVEIGSGLTTLVMGIAAERSGTKIVSLEHDLLWVERMQAAIKQLRLRNVELIYAPLQPQSGGGAWYEVPEGFPKNADLVVCDGPQQRWGRGYLFRELPGLVANTPFIADDAVEGPLLEAIRSWAANLGRSVEILGTQRKFAVVAPRAERLEAAE